MLFVKSRVGSSGYMALPHKQTFCQNLAALWVRKQFLAEQIKYLEVPQLPGANLGQWGRSNSASPKYCR
ncbi:hypothetical protein FOFC_13841 [Fusarium oxysporum]|nr:hypothetical protein FOFC_13841 [Fusarium oxysporum]